MVQVFAQWVKKGREERKVAVKKQSYPAPSTKLYRRDVKRLTTGVRQALRRTCLQTQQVAAKREFPSAA